MECRIKMRSGRERVPRLAGGGASVPADSLGMAERHGAAGNCGSLDRMSLSRQLTVRHGDIAFNWPPLSVTREVAEAPFRPVLLSRKCEPHV